MIERQTNSIEKQKVMNKQELINEARKRVAEIAKATKNCHSEKYTAIYESDNGVTVSHIQKGWSTRTSTINFGSQPMTKKQVLAHIDEVEIMEKEMGLI